ncbi:MAG: response regulator [Candidatus Kerfeldbacteria bacterium]
MSSVKKTSRKKASKSLKRGAQTILLIEDEPLLVSLYASVLRKLTEANVLTASEEHEAMTVINRVIPRLILLDLMIPTTGSALSDFHEPIGFDVLRRVKANPKTRAIHVIILSNLDADEHRQRAHDLGAEEYIVKALLKPRELAERIEKYMGTS